MQVFLVAERVKSGQIVVASRTCPLNDRDRHAGDIGLINQSINQIVLY